MIKTAKDAIANRK